MIYRFIPGTSDLKSDSEDIIKGQIKINEMVYSTNHQKDGLNNL